MYVYAHVLGKIVVQVVVERDSFTFELLIKKDEAQNRRFAGISVLYSASACVGLF